MPFTLESVEEIASLHEEPDWLRTRRREAWDVYEKIGLPNRSDEEWRRVDFKGFKFGVPFDYSMHNFLLRYVVAEAGLDPDKEIQIRAVPPPEMVANLRAGNLDGYLGPDPFNQRAVYENEGFIWMLSKDIWPGHPCCAFAARKDFAESSPNSSISPNRCPGSGLRTANRSPPAIPSNRLKRSRPRNTATVARSALFVHTAVR